eukprot:SAG31_NODE_20591_length_570_cov_0.760085_1_plen_82_part_10
MTRPRMTCKSRQPDGTRVQHEGQVKLIVQFYDPIHLVISHFTKIHDFMRLFCFGFRVSVFRFRCFGFRFSVSVFRFRFFGFF